MVVDYHLNLKNLKGSKRFEDRKTMKIDER